MTRGTPRRILGTGEDPDPRFTLANERTFLAWIRTALALMAAGVAVEAFTDDLLAEPWRRIVALLLLAIGTVVAGASLVRWFRVETALRERRQLPLPLLAPVLAVGILAAAAAVAVVVIGR